MIPTIRILIADKNPIVRAGIQSILASAADLTVVGEAIDGADIVLKSRALRPHVVILDLDLPSQHSVSAILQLKEENPQVNILVLSERTEREQVAQSLRAGAVGYLLKSVIPERLLQAIGDVAKGISVLDPELALMIAQEVNRPEQLTVAEEPLTDREIEILKLIGRGMTNREIADALYIGVRTVGNHVSHIMGKLQVANRTQAALYALRRGFTSLTPETTHNYSGD